MMSRIERFGLSTLLSLTIAAGVGLAQQQDGPPPGGMMGGLGGIMGGLGGGGGDLQLIANPAVQKDLNLTDKQKGQLRSVEQAANAGRQEVFAAARDGGFDPSAIGEQMATIRQDEDAKIGRVLDKKQKTRLGQIKLQRDGMVVVTRSDVSSKLKITNPQTKQIKKVLESMNKEIAAAMPPPPQGFGGPPGGEDGFFDVGPPGGDPNGGNVPNVPKKKGGNRATGGKTATKKGDAAGTPGAPGAPGMPKGGNMEEMRAKLGQGLDAMRKARESASKQIEGLLTDDQKAAWTKLIGEPFDVSTLQQGPGLLGVPGAAEEKGAMKKGKKEAEEK